jgi:glycosyltransferase involved in cell wall biosynthesis
MFKKKILQVIDPSHASWVLGGIFKDLRESSPSFFYARPLIVPAPNNFFKAIWWLFTCICINLFGRVLFSSTTPLENYLKFSFNRTSQKLGLWFTHQDGEFSSRQLKCIKATEVVFCHSLTESIKLKGLVGCKTVRSLGAILPERFKDEVRQNGVFLWVGTCVERKNPQLILDIANESPNCQFRILGNGWKDGKYWSKLANLPNLEYVELAGPLDSSRLEGCEYFLMTSRVEGGPLPLMETVAAGLIPICSDTGFARDIYQIAEIPNELIVETNLESFIQAMAKAKSLKQMGFKVNRHEMLK